LNKRLKIVQIIKGLDIGGDSGGAELFGVKLARELKNEFDCDVWLCAYYAVHTDTEKQWMETLNREGIKTFFVSEWGGTNNIEKFTKGLLNLISMIRREKVDVVHSHFQLGTLAAVLLKSLGLTKVAVRTSHIRQEWNKGRWTWFLFPVFINRIFPSILDAEVGVSRAVCEYLVSRPGKRVKASKVHLIYNGIDIQEIKNQALQPLSLADQSFFSEDRVYIGAVGRLAEQKGYPYLIKAMLDVQKIIPTCELIVVGDGELHDELVTLCSDLGLSNVVRFMGLRKNVPALMTHMGLFVLSSLWEGLPTVVIEAMACGLPVIATDIPGTRELVQNGVTGLLVAEKDADALSNAIIDVLTNAERQKVFVSNAEKAIWKYDMRVIGNAYWDLYQCLRRD